MRRRRATSPPSPTSGILGATTQTLPFRSAGGDSSWGRRDFAWQGGQQLAINFQKRNVLGFALDFAEDRTKTSWGIETSWISQVMLPNTRTFSGLKTHDVITMSVSIDRPTFINFLNPNRSFFVNFQFFMQYIFQYDGGASNRDGSFALASQPFSFPTVAFTFFTGYFQDRLAPRTTLVWSPDTGTGGVLWGLSYRWSGNFTTSLSMNQFFGDPIRVQKGYFPALNYGNRELDTGSNRGLAPVVDRDMLFMNIRYSW